MARLFEDAWSLVSQDLGTLNEQDCLNRLLIASQLRWAPLPPALFPNGYVYFRRPLPPSAQAHALRQRHAWEMEELKREHNELLLGALRTHNARALTTATKAVRRELCLLVHPDKASRFASARLMGEAVMQRLGELAQ